MKSYKILTVCLGNICRSPAAQGILEHIAAQNELFLEIDSAGTAAYHVGNPPDSRSIKTLQRAGIDISQQKARQVTSADFNKFDWILAMDRANLANLKKIQPENNRAKLVMFGEFNRQSAFGEVADPYYGGDEGFETMRLHLNEISEAFVHYLQTKTED
ncbi:low molecular weight phosphotyrosine protein phosphatase [Marinomonas sp. CT5]|uniref:low molecular weight protein-tyrosine-phosphatase n=1 Tax=Marinomonas sp. CT5 TaxID=2066133 RepID=UPI001849FF28|nr:low molecular weight protein-tyrosine-phosphatase [Marinomonas sp. CT5]NVK75199.1 low molecular weight phosphotyrosine protein phosphatase [Oceanospirillaceae bacterium]QUX95852.1 low molecular weight phosphotyrosine protein phosphatase [Marinomonas sp. CT5]